MADPSHKRRRWTPGCPFRAHPDVDPAPSVLAVDCNADDLRLRLRGLRQRHRQDAVLERGLDLVLLDLVAKGNLPLEAAIEALAELTLLVLDLRFLLASDGQNAIGEQDLDVLLLQAWDIS